ncbi:mechanosensitive ion channel protein MscS [Alteromonadales bacterium alter-6D02]|nr:mechanosensitive ion channel protein MscS [Alteromonadales bacterium alter-6D02]
MIDIASFNQWLLEVGQHQLGLASDSIGFPLLRLSLLVLAISLLHIVTVSCVIPLIRKAIVRMHHAMATYLLKHQLFINLLRFIPVVLALKSTEFIAHPTLETVWLKLANIVLVIYSAKLLFSLLNALHDLLEHRKITRDMPIKQVMQLLKLAVIAVASIIAISTLLDKSPTYLLSGLTAASAVILLIFRDSILGFAAGIQVASQKLVKVGDWIILGSQADGEVVSISITTCTVKNWDNSLSFVPAYDLINKPFKNFQQMYGSGRRIKRSLNIDTDSVRFFSEQEIEKMSQITRLAPCVIQKKQELAEANQGVDNHNDVAEINLRKMTNLGCFRTYIKNYLLSHPAINSQATVLVRQLQPTERGIPLELYCFTHAEGTAWVAFEELQADIFDHLLASIHVFDLSIHQHPSSRSVDRISQTLT